MIKYYRVYNLEFSTNEYVFKLNSLNCEDSKKLKKGDILRLNDNLDGLNSYIDLYRNDRKYSYVMDHIFKGFLLIDEISRMNVYQNEKDSIFGISNNRRTKFKKIIEFSDLLASKFLEDITIEIDRENKLNKIL